MSVSACQIKEIKTRTHSFEHFSYYCQSLDDGNSRARAVRLESRVMLSADTGLMFTHVIPGLIVIRCPGPRCHKPSHVTAELS